MDYYLINRKDWDKKLEELLESHHIFAPVPNEFSLDYEVLTPSLIPLVSYNKPKPASPLKIFFTPIKENVTSLEKDEKPIIILGVPNCDVEALGILDEIYLDESFEDIFYRKRRKKTLIISADCFDVQEHCHCTSYGVKPWSEQRADLAVAFVKDKIILRVTSEKGKTFVTETLQASPLNDNGLISSIENRHREIEDLLNRTNKELPNYKETGRLVKSSSKAIWVKHSSTCVSCGACTTICPTCTCFLLIDKPGFHKVKQMDACQYPGFEKTAGGEDPLKELHERFRNRYMCKYVWKPEKFKHIACTGCGRCIEACIGKINKNKLFIELAK
ncbi:MAG: 4Fe-4S dicluster domain-containing protein [Bacteroidales bacterium]